MRRNANCLVAPGLVTFRPVLSFIDSVFSSHDPVRKFRGRSENAPLAGALVFCAGTEPAERHHLKRGGSDPSSYSPPVAAPNGLTGTWARTRSDDAIRPNWSPVPGAVGYVIDRGSGTTAPFSWPGNFLTALVETTYTDQGNIEKTPM